MSEPRQRAAQLLVRQYVAQAHAAVRQRELAALACRRGAGGASASFLVPSSSSSSPSSILALVRGLRTTTTPGRPAPGGAAQGAAAAAAASRGAPRPHQAFGAAAADAAARRGAVATPSSLLPLFVRRLRSTLALSQEAATAAATSSSSPAAAALLTTNPALRLASPSLPDSARRALSLWLAGCAAWTFSMVALGGATRLTRSGLSMTDWRFAGEKLPLTPQDWEDEFAKYRASPEYRLLHSHMTVDDFKFIFAMEYAHRMWGRLLGLGFALPCAYFAVRGAINGPLAARLGLLMAMGGAQGLVGWWMVRSGLKEPRAAVVVAGEEGAAGAGAGAAGAAAGAPALVVAEGGGCEQVPRVSPYRLAAHLTSAFAIYATLVWTSLSLWQPVPAAAAAPPAAAAAATLLRRRALPLAALVGVTAASGAFVAGLDAGHAYNTFPTMNGRWIPEEYWGEDDGSPRLPWWRNAFENTAAVQLHHRALALTTLSAATGLWLAHRRLPLPGHAGGLLAAAAGITLAQASLGVATLLACVPPTLGTAHQAGALTLFTALLALMHSVRPASPSSLALAVSRLSPPLALAGTAAIATAVVTQH